MLSLPDERRISAYVETFRLVPISGLVPATAAAAIFT
jgi:hypothetical protein